jgi:hypothetical protein
VVLRDQGPDGPGGHGKADDRIRQATPCSHRKSKRAGDEAAEQAAEVRGADGLTAGTRWRPFVRVHLHMSFRVRLEVWVGEGELFCWLVVRAILRLAGPTCRAGGWQLMILSQEHWMELRAFKALADAGATWAEIARETGHD